MDGIVIGEAIKSVTAKWTQQRKAEERNRKSITRRRQTLCSSARKTVIEAAEKFMPTAYWKASTEGKYPAFCRQVMYAARDPIQEHTGQLLDDRYFCQTILPDYLNRHPKETATWDVVFDARGHFEEPHTRTIVPLGTLDVRRYEADIREAEKMIRGIGLKAMSEKHGLELVCRLLPFTTCGPSNRFAAILFVEKEGFLPLFRAVHLAERYDIAIMSTKGVSVTAARRLVDFLSGEFKVPVLIMHDCDQNGFCTLGSMQRSNRRYKFKNVVDVRDVGLGAQDVKNYKLKPEMTTIRGENPAPNLRLNGATKEDVAFLLTSRRVELNMFSSDGLLIFMDDKFRKLRVRKVVPDQDTLVAAFRSIVARVKLEARVEAARAEVIQQADMMKVPENLVDKVAKGVKENSARPWDRVLEQIAKDELAKKNRARRGG